MLLKALWTRDVLVCSEDQLWTSCSVPKWHSSLSNSMSNDVTHWAIGLYSDHNKSYVVYLQWHFCFHRHPRLHMYSGIPLIQKLIFYKSWYFSSWAKYSEVWKSSNNIFTLTVVASPDSMSPILPSCSALKSTDPQSPGPSAFPVKCEGIPETIDREIDALEPAAEGKGDNPDGNIHLISCAACM